LTGRLNHLLLGIAARERKLLLSLDLSRGSAIALDEITMQRTIRTKITFGFLILAFGLMVTDCYRLMRAPTDATLSANNVQHAHKF
jgi:hypothetical protein